MPTLEALPPSIAQGDAPPTEAHPNCARTTSEPQLNPASISTEGPSPPVIISTEARQHAERPLHFGTSMTAAETKRAPRPQPKIPTTDLRLKDTHRLIASRYSDTGTVLSRLSSNPDTLGKLLELDDATNDRFLGEEGLLPGIGIHELVYGIRYAHIVNAAFTHASPAGGRFNSPTRGAWYASLDRDTSIAEVAFHKLRALEEIDWPHEEISTSDDYLADITSSFHDLRTASIEGHPQNPGASTQPSAPSITASSSWVSSGDTSGQPTNPGVPDLPVSIEPRTNHFARYLRPEPIPRCYQRPQQLAERLLARKSNGVVYPSVRRLGGTCLVVFRPALVYNVRRGARLELRLQPHCPFLTSQVREVPIPNS